MKIGIVIHANAALFSNGITQNAYFIYQCLSHIGFECVLLCNESASRPFDHDAIPIQSLHTIQPETFNAIITVTRPISKELYATFKRLHVPVISFVCGNAYMNDQESFVYNGKTHFYGSLETADEVWTIPSYMQFKQYMEIIYKKPVRCVSHLWHPCVLKKRAEHMSKVAESTLFYSPAFHTSSQIDIIIVEPNIAYFKNAWLPLIASEALHMRRPDLINNIYVFNFPEHATAYEMIDGLSVRSKIRPFKRKEMDEILVHFSAQTTIPVFLTHHNNNSLNYVYYEALNYGFPLLHNSADLVSCGYYYTDLLECVDQLIAAAMTHGERLDAYKESARRFLQTIDPVDADVGEQWKTMVHRAILRA